MINTDNKWLDEMLLLYRKIQLEPPFKNSNGDFVNQFGDLIDMKLWGCYDDDTIKRTIERMKTDGRIKIS